VDSIQAQVSRQSAPDPLEDMKYYLQNMSINVRIFRYLSLPHQFITHLLIVLLSRMI